MSMTVLGPLPDTAPRLDVVRDWRVDELIPFLEEPQEAVEAAIAKLLNYRDDARPQLFVPPHYALPPAPLTGHRTYVVVNQKGGAGKTTTSVELAAAWVAMGYTVRIIDADPQDASVTRAWLRPNFEGVPEKERYTLTDVLYGRQPLDECTYETAVQGLYLVPSFEDLKHVEFDGRAARDQQLRAAIRKSTVPVDITIIDAPPALGKLSINGLVAADEVILPMQVSALDKEALSDLKRTIEGVQSVENPDLIVAAAVMTNWSMSNLVPQIAATIRRDYPGAIISPARRNVKAAAAPARGLPLRALSALATTALDYNQLAHTLLPVKDAA
ncbi:AAA family ATPase [Streptomyces sp. LP11]|uniref:AAA family ATPase n=1 Tax=Streptomyces pyxinicus TaxID=2970331 RepID=A0ABT2BBY2_9ACTN|nr:AAA family ATPase [Streptomyces sp. LP11]MCS0606019.1 AAA family ATPase [Streptomyces sp. LP11]